jgi:hypothetical protein
VNSDPRTRDYWLLHCSSGSPSGDPNFFRDNGLVIIVNPPPIGGNVNACSFIEPLGDEELKPAIGVGRGFNHGILLGRRMILI